MNAYPALLQVRVKCASQGQGNPVVKVEFHVQEGDGDKMVWRQKVQVVVSNDLQPLEACSWPKVLFSTVAV